MTKKTVKCFLVVFILISLIIPSCLTAAAADTKEISLNVKYNQSEARTMLDMINKFRTGSEAWYWNATDTEKIYKNNLTELDYDYGLEEIAMQRAAEIAVSFSHTRPDGTSCFTATSKSGHTSNGENIAYGYNMFNTASSVFEAWQETNENYSGQGHRRNMLNESFTHVGIGYASVNGRNYWVQEFGYSTGTAKTSAENGNKTVKVNAQSSLADRYTTNTTNKPTVSTTAKPTKETATKAKWKTTTKSKAETTATTGKQTASTTKPTTEKAATTKPATENAQTAEKPNTSSTAITKEKTTSSTATATEKPAPSSIPTTTEKTTATAATSASTVTTTTTSTTAASSAAASSTVTPATDPSTTAPAEAPIEAAAEQAPSGNDTSFFIGMATLAVIVAAGICTFIFIRSRKK